MNLLSNSEKLLKEWPPITDPGPPAIMKDNTTPWALSVCLGLETDSGEELP